MRLLRTCLLNRRYPFKKNYYVSGLWIGFFIGSALAAFFYIFLVYRINWDEQAERVKIYLTLRLSLFKQ